jgi:mRNA-degrading endonuclease RelE of RelBE toxin-antitoxin system
MVLEIEWSRKAERDLGKLSLVYQEKIDKAVVRFAEEGYGDVKKLKGEEGEYRLRVGPYRVFFTFTQEEDEGPPVVVIDIMYIIKIRNRGEAYRKK